MSILLRLSGLVALFFVLTALVPTQSTEAYTVGTQRVVDLVNQERRKAGLPPYAVNSSLNRAAQTYSNNMARYNCFSHSCPPVTSLSARVQQAGYTGWRALGENIARGYTTPEAVVAGWMASPGHRANILSRTYTEIGIGVATGNSGTYWVQDFGTR